MSMGIPRGGGIRTIIAIIIIIIIPIFIIVTVMVIMTEKMLNGIMDIIISITIHFQLDFLGSKTEFSAPALDTLAALTDPGSQIAA